MPGVGYDESEQPASRIPVPRDMASNPDTLLTGSQERRQGPGMFLILGAPALTTLEWASAACFDD